jgi:hypothetical protein
MATHGLNQTMALIARTPVVFDSLLRGLPDVWTLRNEGEGTWSPADIVGHLIYADQADWLPRTRIIMEHGDAVPFPPFDRAGHVPAIRGKSIPQLLDEFVAVRSSALSELRALNLGPSDLERRGRHPVLGAVTLSELLATWAAHDLNHMHQVSRVMADQYRAAVGPFQKFLGVMQCNAHGA